MQVLALGWSATNALALVLQLYCVMYEYSMFVTEKKVYSF
jgi:hypothetical protein